MASEAQTPARSGSVSEVAGPSYPLSPTDKRLQYGGRPG